MRRSEAKFRAILKQNDRKMRRVEARLKRITRLRLQDIAKARTAGAALKKAKKQPK
jgi:hypothetical protein